MESKMRKKHEVQVALDVSFDYLVADDNHVDKLNMHVVEVKGYEKLSTRGEECESSLMVSGRAMGMVNTPMSESTAIVTLSSDDLSNSDQSSSGDYEDEELTCNVCDRSFIDADALERHHFKYRHWGCDVCESLFNTEMELEYHKDFHEHWSDDDDYHQDLSNVEQELRRRQPFHGRSIAHADPDVELTNLDVNKEGRMLLP